MKRLRISAISYLNTAPLMWDFEHGHAGRAFDISYTVPSQCAADLAACNALSHRIHGFDRGPDLAQAIEQGNALVTERGGRITAYASHLGFFGHSVAESNADLQALIASVDSFAGPGILLPTRNAELFRWCLGNGLRVIEPMTLMSMGLYNEPAGAFLPSVMF